MNSEEKLGKLSSLSAWLPCCSPKRGTPIWWTHTESCNFFKNHFLDNIVMKRTT